MIRNTLPHTKKCTYSVLIPHHNPEAKGFPVPNGTGFFISKEGHFITARHVILDSEKNIIPEEQIKLTKKNPDLMIKKIKIIKEWPDLDIVLLKAEMDKEIDFLEIDFNTISEGTPIYSFGYPLSDIKIKGNQNIMVGFHFFSPRTTSAIISSHFELIGPVYQHDIPPKHYIIDKALNYGNSGGPIIVSKTGKVISICSRFQPVKINQVAGTVMIPSLYGVTTSLKNIESELNEELKK